MLYWSFFHTGDVGSCVPHVSLSVFSHVSQIHTFSHVFYTLSLVHCLFPHTDQCASQALAWLLCMWTFIMHVRGCFCFFPHSLDTQNNLCVHMFYVFITGNFDFPDLIHSMCVRVEPPSDGLHPFIYFPCVFCMRR